MQLSFIVSCPCVLIRLHPAVSRVRGFLRLVDEVFPRTQLCVSVCIPTYICGYSACMLLEMSAGLGGVYQVISPGRLRGLFRFVYFNITYEYKLIEEVTVPCPGENLQSPRSLWWAVPGRTNTASLNNIRQHPSLTVWVLGRQPQRSPFDPRHTPMDVADCVWAYQSSNSSVNHFLYPSLKTN